MKRDWKGEVRKWEDWHERVRLVFNEMHEESPLRMGTARSKDRLEVALDEMAKAHKDAVLDWYKNEKPMEGE